MTQTATHGPDHIETNPDPAAFAHWPDGLYEEMLSGQDSGVVGSVLVSETERVRVWHLTIPAGGRCGFHRHVNPYFWTVLSAGRARNYFSSGKVSEMDYTVGETRHFHYGAGDYMIHCVENIGETELSFTTVEFLDGPNAPLEVPPEVRLVATNAA